jgi:hypothetical protein
LPDTLKASSCCFASSLISLCFVHPWAEEADRRSSHLTSDHMPSPHAPPRPPQPVACVPVQAPSCMMHTPSPMDLGPERCLCCQAIRTCPSPDWRVAGSPLSVTQPTEESFAEISLPKALGSTSAHTLRCRHIATPARGRQGTADLLSLLSARSRLPLQSPVSGVGKSLLLLSDSIVAEVP